jgi:LuxR family glucitol operon transcriptional activator
VAHSIKRLTIYAWISALEIDLRELINLYIVPSLGVDALLPAATEKQSRQRFDKDNPGDAPTLSDLLNYLDLDEEIKTIRKHDARLDTGTRSYLKKYYIGLESIISVRNRVMHSRPLEYDDLSRVSDLAFELIKSHRSLWAHLRTTRQQLQHDHDFASSITIPDAIDTNTTIWHNLPQPEFDDTGFVGRDKEIFDLKKALAGPYPIVTVAGEGGVGKSALALKVCYDLLDDTSSQIDAIIWTTAKTTRLTLNDIELIDGSVSTSLGLIDSAASIIGRQETSATDDLIMHLTNNKILLIIDNLETILDHTIRDLVTRVPSGSKILFTTRIGLGAFDYPIPVNPMNKRDASVFFRLTARAWSLLEFVNSPNDVVDDYCEKLEFNALYIKWFLQSVRVGRRPTILLSDPRLFLEFCLQNVFNTLSAESKLISTVLLCINGSHSVASLAFYTDLDSLSVQSALSYLITANLISTERGRNTEDEDRYSLNSLARMYIDRFLKPASAQQKLLMHKQNELRTAKQLFSARMNIDIYDFNSVCIRDQDDYIPAKYLTKAIEHVFKERYDAANELIDKAFDLSPNYFEVHRVRAFAFAQQQEAFSAKNEYEAAIALAGDRAPLRLWFGGLLSRTFDEQEAALEQILKAEQLAPEATPVKLELARLFQILHRFDEAAERLDAIKDGDRLPAKMRRIFIDLSIQNNRRRAEYLAENEDFEGAMKYLQAARDVYEAAPKALIDEKTEYNLKRGWRTVSLLKRAFMGLPSQKLIIDFAKWLAMIGWDGPESSQISRDIGEQSKSDEDVEESSVSEESPPNRGLLTDLRASFAFIKMGNRKLFFHKTDWTAPLDFKFFGEGTVVQFDIKENKAVNVCPVGEASSQPLMSKRFLGAVQKMQSSFGYIKMDTGGDIFFGRNDCAATTRFGKLVFGERVRFNVALDENGRLRATKVEVYSGTAT